MQKLFNKTSTMVDESIKGFVKNHRRYVSYAECSRTLKLARAPVAGKVGVVSGGGSGHDPAFMGYIGENMLDAVAIGDIFTPPTAESFYAAFKAADGGKGVVCLYGNYEKDIESAEEAINRAAEEGIVVKTVIADDDVAQQDRKTHRGLTGEVLLWKIGGAAAALGYDLDGVVAVTEKAIKYTRSIGIGLSSCIIPEVGRPNYLIEEGTMEIGVGHHGFSSKDTCKLKSADETADVMIDEILNNRPLKKGDEIAIMINGLGNTMLNELYILYNRVDDVVKGMGVEINHARFSGISFSIKSFRLSL
jgi:dihydroxyacetone kinase-like protein